VDDDAAVLGRVGDCRERCADVRAEVREVGEVAVGEPVLLARAPPPRFDVRSAVLGILGPEERRVHDLDRDVARRVAEPLLVEAEVDDAPDPVRDERGPAGGAQRVDVVGADDRAAPRCASVLGRQPAQVADVEASVPLEHTPGHRLLRTSTSVRAT
jgi:hypothetical protein